MFPCSGVTLGSQKDQMVELKERHVLSEINQTGVLKLTRHLLPVSSSQYGQWGFKLELHVLCLRRSAIAHVSKYLYFGYKADLLQETRR